MTNDLEYGDVDGNSFDKDDDDHDDMSVVEDVVVVVVFSWDSNFPNFMTISPRQHSEGK